MKNVAELCPSYAGGGFVSFGMLSPTRATDRMALTNRQELLQRDDLKRVAARYVCRTSPPNCLATYRLV